MTLKKLHTIAIFFTTAIFLFASNAHASNQVLCVGDDGHVEVEVSYDGDCSTEESAHIRAALLQNAPEHCGPCEDIPIEVGHADTCHTVNRVEKTQPAAPISVVVLVTLDTQNLQYTSRRVHSVPDTLPIAIICLRTVSLII